MKESALELLLKEQARITPQSPLDRILVSADRSFDLLKMLGTTGRVFYQGKKVVIDPFTFFDIYFEGEGQGSEKAQFFGRWECDWVFPADPSWILKEGIIRAVKEEVSGKWVSRCLCMFSLEGSFLIKFLDEADAEIRIEWKTPQTNTVVDPFPFLVLADRHGGFADLWFDYATLKNRSARSRSSLL